MYIYIASGTYTKLIKMVHTGALSGQTVVAPPFTGYKRGFTGSNRVNPCHHRREPWRYRSSSGLYRPNTGAYRGSPLRTVYHGGDKDVPGLRRYRPDAVPVLTRLLPASSRFTTVFDSLPGLSRFVPVVLNILKQPGT